MTWQGRRIDDTAAAQLIRDTEPFLSCDDCFAMTDQCVEDLLTTDDLPDEALRVHLAACPACLEDVTSLIELVAGDRGRAVEPLLDRLAVNVQP